MQRTSDSIASLAAALAKAQIELANPEKSLVGTIEPTAGEGSARLFRYASLSSGLEIVRKTLGQHEIATVQSTAIDQASRHRQSKYRAGACLPGEWTGRLGLAGLRHRRDRHPASHGSGADLCPALCAVHPGRHCRGRRSRCTGSDQFRSHLEIARPAQRVHSVMPPVTAGSLKRVVTSSGKLDARSPNLAARTPLPRQDKAHNRINQARAAMHTAVLLSFKASARLRDQMLGELNAIGSEDEAAKWAHRRSCPTRTSSIGVDAKHIEEIFGAKLKAFAIHHAEGLSPSEHGSEASSPAEPVEPVTETDAPEPKRKPRGKSVDKSVLSHPEPRRIRDRDHVRFVAQQACLICGRKPCDAHHLRFAQSRALGRKVSDEFTVPLCRGHHRELHRHGDEAKWWSKTSIDPTLSARELWLESHP